MNIKVFKNPGVTGNPSAAAEGASTDASDGGNTGSKEMVRELSNGCRLVRNGNTFFAAVGDEKVEISREEAILILQNHDLIYYVIIEAKRKFYFNTAEDRYSPTDY